MASGNRSNQRPSRSITRTEQELSYAAQLEQFIAENPYSQVKRFRDFGLYAPRQDVTNFLIRYEIFKRVLEVQGSIIECGVFRGGGLVAWPQFSAILEPTNHQGRVVGLDTFSGFAKLGANGDRFRRAEPEGLAWRIYRSPGNTKAAGLPHRALSLWLGYILCPDRVSHPSRFPT